MSEAWKMPDLEVGDAVYFYDNPSNLQSPAMGWVIEKPGVQTISILIFSQNAGFIEKKSVRHADDPFWSESEMAPSWQRWGCFKLHPLTEIMPVLGEMIRDWKVSKARRSGSGGVNK